MEDAQPGQLVEFRGLKGAAHLNGTRGHLVRFLPDQQRWAVSTVGDDYQVVNVKPENLKRAEKKKEYFVHPLTGQIMVPKGESTPVTDSRVVIEGMESLHAAVLGAYHDQRKGGVVVSSGDDYMMAIDFYGPHGNGGVYGEMVYVDKDASAQAVVRKRNCRQAAELGRNFLGRETIVYIDAAAESDFFDLLSKYKPTIFDAGGMIDMKSGLDLHSVRIAK